MLKEEMKMHIFPSVLYNSMKVQYIPFQYGYHNSLNSSINFAVSNLEALKKCN
jgi:hypothetical protein